ncbi:MAG: Uma2 family endonuclease [Hormoscilla sp. GM102CHS1]|nr:Uma2 family endonuclease [Hormoscilla sp. GM102CHS1]
MIASKSYTYISPEEYLESEKISPIKHEYRQGEVYAMSGVSKAHDKIAGNLFGLLLNQIRSTGCSVYTPDMKVRVEAADVFYYPDMKVTCDARDDRNPDEHFIRYPRLIVEVLSPTTQGFDRGEKFANYRLIETLQEYVLISQERMTVECFRLNAEGRWVPYTYRPGEEVHLASVDFRCPIADIYEKVPGLNS